MGSSNYLPLYVKDPVDALFYEISWADWLGAGETITTSSFTVPSGLTKVSESNTTTVAVVKLSGGTAGITYRCSNTITTSTAQTVKKAFDIRVEER